MANRRNHKLTQNLTRILRYMYKQRIKISTKELECRLKIKAKIITHANTTYKVLHRFQTPILGGFPQPYRIRKQQGTQVKNCYAIDQPI